ncbi:MAG: hypothetical protein HXS43_11955 [Theionarchaea archaeon]|nr:hypothetical protein [Theionarchaea archaeon]
MFTWDEQGEEPSKKKFWLGEKPQPEKLNWINYEIAQALQNLQDGTVRSINNLTGDTNLVPGDNIQIDVIGQNIQISGSGGSGSGPHLHTGFGWEARSDEFTGEKRGCTIFNNVLYVTGYSAQAGSNRIHEFDMNTLSLIATHVSPSEYGWGLTNDGQYLYEVDNNYTSRVYRIDPTDFSSTLLTLGTATDGHLYGICYDSLSQTFWLTDGAKNIYRYSQDLQTQELKESLPHGQYPAGLTFDGSRIWISFVWDYNFQHMIALTTDLLPRIRQETIGEWYGVVYDTTTGKMYGSCRYANQKFRIFRTLEIKSVI